VSPSSGKLANKLPVLFLHESERCSETHYQVVDIRCHTHRKSLDVTLGGRSVLS
jgi:hypothetical protein